MKFNKIVALALALVMVFALCACGGGNTDTMMLITFDTVNKTINGMSLPRDTMINVDRKGSGHRLNAVYNYNKGSDPDTQVEKGTSCQKRGWKAYRHHTGLLCDGPVGGSGPDGGRLGRRVL